jgi:glucose/arabinose dehydrogenase
MSGRRATTRSGHWISRWDARSSAQNRMAGGRWTVAVLGAAALLVLTTACGDDGEAERSSGAEGAADETSSSATATVPAGVTPLADVPLSLTEVGQFDEPTAVVSRPGDDGTLFVAERGGRVVEVGVDGEGTDPADYDVVDTPLVDISDEVETGYIEQGLLDVVFNPDGSRLYLHYSDNSNGGGTHVVSYDYDGADVDPDSRREVLELDQPHENHNGGEMAFGPDGYLYLALGDGGDGGDPDGNGQDVDVLLGKVLRIDPEASADDGGEGYEVPEDNPFVDDDGAQPEVWLYGVRNPWRFSFDTETGDLWIGDVGQDSWEEVDWLPASDGRDAGRGANLGWNLVEGTHGFEGENPDGGVLPVVEYATHEDGACAVTGGYVYRGAVNEALQGAYVYADYCSGSVQALRLADGAVADQRTFDVQAAGLSSFGTDNAGELYAVSLEGPLYRLGL